MSERKQRQKSFVVGLGEILWDIFPDGPRFGGAPANFACTVSALGAGRIESAVVSAVGEDDLGRRALQTLNERGLDVTGVETRGESTGRVDVQLDDEGHATYQFADNTAWDHLTWSDDLERLARRTCVVCFGTLGQRSEPSRTTIRRFVDATASDAFRILDVNLRSPHWTNDVIAESLQRANVLKCNDEELPVIGSLLKLSGSDESVLRQVIDRCSLRLAVLTRGAEGSLIVDSTGTTSERPVTSVEVKDTVGAGDAMTAAIAIGLLHNVELPEMHAHADRVAAYVCTQSGATPTIPQELRFSEAIDRH